MSNSLAMSPAARPVATCVLAGLLLLGVTLTRNRVFSDPPADAVVLEQRDGRTWYRGNMHTHTHWSDGDDYPEMVALWYRDHGYNFLVMTDHNVMQVGKRWVDLARTKGGDEAYNKLKQRFPGDWVETRQRDAGKTEIRLKTLDEIEPRVSLPGSFLLVHGEEISDHFEKLPLHLNAMNLSQVILPHGGKTLIEAIQADIDAVMDQRARTGRPMIVHINHPNFGFAIRAEDLMRIRGSQFFEVYNGHPGVYNEGTKVYPGTERLWDICLARRLTDLRLPLLYGLAVDDGHAYHSIPSRASEPGRGWVMVLADELTPDALIESLEAGRFYSSSGVTLNRITSSARRLEVQIAAEEGVTYKTQFIGTHRGFDRATKATPLEKGKPLHVTETHSPDIGAILKTVEGPEAAYDFASDLLYVRAVVTSSRRHPNPSSPGEFERAWIQPVTGPAAVDPE